MLAEIQPIPKPHSQDGKSLGAYPVSPRRTRAQAPWAISDRSSGVSDSALHAAIGPVVPRSARLRSGLFGILFLDIARCIRITMMQYATGLFGRFLPFGGTGMGIPPVAGGEVALYKPLVLV